MNTLRASNGLIVVRMGSTASCDTSVTSASVHSMTWVVALLAAILVAGSDSALAQQKVGYVLQIEGTWTLRGASQPLALGQSLPEMGLLRNPSPRDRDNIVIADLRGEVIKNIRCKSGVCKECHESGGCYDPVQPLPAAGVKATAFGTTLSAVLELFAGRPDRYSMHRARGSEALGKDSGVARLEGSTVDVSYFMHGLEKGSYEVQLISLAVVSGSGQEWRSAVTTVNWNPGESVPLVLKGIQPGLYLLSFEHKSALGFAWVLLCDSAAYPSVVASFEGFAKQMDEWGDSVPQDARKSYQRAYLDYLATNRFSPTQ